MTRDLRWLPAVAALGAALAIAAVLAVVGRTINRPPTIAALEVHPPTVARGAAATVRVVASDPDGDRLRFDYKADTGGIVRDTSRPDHAIYRPAVEGGIVDRLTVVVTDARGLSTTHATAVTLSGPAPTPAPTTPVPATTEAPVEASPAASPTPTASAPTTRRRTAAPAPPPADTAARPANRPPVLEPGYRIHGLGTHTVRLLASGHDPDDDPITHEWDGSGCFEILSQSATEAEVKFAEGCAGGTMKLIWTDPHGASASTTWPISK